jgi:hypothetical protein
LKPSSIPKYAFVIEAPKEESRLEKVLKLKMAGMGM